MIQAERLLLAAALEDHANQRFVLLSDRLVFSSLVVLAQVSVRSCSFSVSVPLLSFVIPFLRKGGVGLGICLCKITCRWQESEFLFSMCSCVPLYNFSYVYNYLMVSPRSFVDR